LYNLKLRHANEKPYTRTGDIVIAVNPYQWYRDLYTEQKQKYYFQRIVADEQNDSTDDPRNTMEPHVYEVSALAYKGLLQAGSDGETQNQSILVSGESGAGKTETVKICLNHIASIQKYCERMDSGGKIISNNDSCTEAVVQRVVQSNPLLEAFGNAKTRRNDNSSRFGKYIQLQFDQQNARRCQLVGSQCDVYLLEKNRVICHDSKERTFHIFYQLLAAPDKDKSKFWTGLRGATNDSFKYVGQTSTDTIEGIKDCDRFQQTIESLKMIGVAGTSLNALMRAICIVLQLGNLGFSGQRNDSDKSVVATNDELQALSNLMDIPAAELTLAFTERTFSSGNDVYKVPLNPDSAKEACDALAKETYQRIFLWLVNSINKATSTESVATNPIGTIGLLDIFGFEVFPLNGFEQLCINYANEKLQHKFTEDIFTNVQAEYKAEGICLNDIYYDDNTDVLDLIEGRTGLLNLLNEECIRPKGNDFEYVQKSLQLNKSSPALLVHKTDRMSFGVRHYAGQVMYDGQFFVTKNLDTLPTDLQECVQKCSNPIISSMEQGKTATPAKLSNSRNIGGRVVQSNITAATVWTKYKSQLSELMKNLRKTQSRYIRCIKPNSKKEPYLMEHEGTVDQLRCAGVIAGITISRSVFPNRLPNSVVLARYSGMWDNRMCSSMKTVTMSVAEQRAADCMAIMEDLLKSKQVTTKGKIVKAFVVGTTRTYFRAGALEWLESHRMRNLDVQAVTIQRLVRGWYIRHMLRFSILQKQRDDEAREAERSAEIDRKARQTQEEIERKIARLLSQKRMVERIAELEQFIKQHDRERDNLICAGYERIKKTKVEIEEMMASMTLEGEHAVKERVIELVEQDKRIDENAKLIAYLRKENIRARKEHEKFSKKLRAEKQRRDMVETSHHDLSESVDCAEELAIQEVKSHAAVKKKLEEVKNMANMASKDVLNHQKEYLDEAKKRLELQKIVARLVLLTQETVASRNVVEEVVIIALSAESTSKAIMVRVVAKMLNPKFVHNTSSSALITFVCPVLFHSIFGVVANRLPWIRKLPMFYFE
jgi:myosin V